LRLLAGHPEVEVAQAASRSRAGDRVTLAHPHLRGRTDLRFCSFEELEPCDLLFLALPHGEASARIEEFARLGTRIVDCSADFRLRDAGAYETWYKSAHQAPEWLDRFVYGLPELERGAIAGSRYASGVGCNATAVILALLPLAKAGALDEGRPIVADVKVGSSEGGREPSESSHHPERSGIVRAFAPVGHRHGAEVQAALGRADVHLSISAVELVRGAAATCHAWLKKPLAERDLWELWRSAYAEEPFVRIVHERGGLYRHPEPRLVAGTNRADVGWALDEDGLHVVALSAIDNLGKGAAGTAVQCLNVMLGLEETLGLETFGVHPL
jgi:N-acetyl-gamma-glutamyl-phosphate/LysW-gamma-L-alpha-aminoadipyl-6-phosphate reductase